jgi:hypothetical protein
MKEQSIPWLHFAIDQFVAPPRLFDPLGISSFLIPRGKMVYSTDSVRATKNLQATVLLRRAINRNQATGHIRIQTAVGIPISIVLMPFPSTTDSRLFEHHLVMVMINLTTQ